jgi:tripartite-type tricarboxylate transporter receptor subunit TctC
MTANGVTRRGAIGGIVAAAVLGAGQARRAHAQQGTTIDSTGHIIVGYPAGGPTDTIARLCAERLRGRYAPQLIVENRAGAAGRIGVEAVKAASPDGTSVLMTPVNILTIFPHVYPKTIRYDALVDLIPVSPICASPFAFTVNADHPARDLAGFAAWARQQKSAVSFANPATGGGPHFFGTKMAQNLGLQLQQVPYRGAAPAVQDVRGGQVPCVVSQVGDVAEFHRAGQMRILAVSSAQRLPSFPDVPTLVELGQKEMIMEEWFGFLLPAQTPARIVEGLHNAIVAAASNPELQAMLARQECRSFTTSPKEFAEFIRADRERWGPIVQESGFKAE